VGFHHTTVNLRLLLIEIVRHLCTGLSEVLVHHAINERLQRS
jgi:hypothetical protein